MVCALYAIGIGVSEWRLHRHVESVRAAETTSVVEELTGDTEPATEVAP